MQYNKAQRLQGNLRMQQIPTRILQVFQNESSEDVTNSRIISGAPTYDINLCVSHPRRRTPHPRQTNDAKHLILLPMGNDILYFVSSSPTSRRRFFIIESTPLSFENHHFRS